MKKAKTQKDNSMSKIVYDAIYKRIISGNLQPGEKITETNISNTLGISRAPVREALKMLAENRLVVLVPYSGCHIANPDKDEIVEIYEIRKRLESMALECALDKFDLKQLKELKKEFLNCQKLAGKRLINREVKLDAKLHSLIVETSSCKNLQELLDKIKIRLQLFRIKTSSDIKRAKIALKEHIEIIDNILANDKTKSIKSLKKHIVHTRDNIINSFKD